MGITILKKKPGYTIALALCIIGALMLLAVIWTMWNDGVFSSPDVPSALSTSLFNTTLGIEPLKLSLIYYLILGFVLLIGGVAILVGRRERVTVVEEVSALLECPFCKNQWRESLSKAHLKSMGYPKVRTLSRRKCTQCAKFMRPKIASTEK
ncbi:MAG: hypothetical protein JSV12_01250 [Candidatus Bathyarchaeota archaeon]|nr:MAG: hypothetical protein JSV12_01250 [Candidatus Bathyarchaeota archaeon]